MIHQYITSDHLDAEILVRERLGLDVGQGSQRGSQKLKPLAQKYVKEPREEDAKTPLPLAQDTAVVQAGLFKPHS